MEVGSPEVGAPNPWDRGELTEESGEEGVRWRANRHRKKGPHAVCICRKRKQRAVAATERVGKPSVPSGSANPEEFDVATTKIGDRVYNKQTDGSGHAIYMMFVTILTMLRGAGGTILKYSKFHVF